MTSEPAHSVTADTDLFLPVDGLRLLGEHQGSGYAGHRFLVGRSDGQVIQLPLLLYLIVAAIAEGSLDGGWSADQVSARVRAASGQGLTADNVRYLIAGKLAPLGLIAAGGADRCDHAPGAARLPRANLLPGLKIRGLPLGRRATGTTGRVLSWPAADRVEQLLLRYRRRRWPLVLGGTAMLVSVAAAAPIMAGTGNRETGATRSASVPASGSASAAASRSQAAAWVVQQVSPDVTVLCDPGMCRLLQRDGFPIARLKPLPRGARGPVSSGVVVRSGVVVATPAIQNQFGPRLAAAYAPQVIASFGSGVAQVAVRTIAPDGAAAFRAQLATEMTALASAGRQLLGNKNIQAAPTARAELRAGRVDARLLAILALLSTQMPVQLASFSAAPGAGPGVPLREAEISVISPALRSAVLTLLAAQQSPYRPAVTDGGSRSMITLRFDAPASLNLSQP
jgi:hypothetical protein